MSERILMKFIVGQRVVKEGEDSRFEGQVVACFVKRDLKTLRYVIENDDGVMHIANERLRLAMPKAPGATEVISIPGKLTEQWARYLGKSSRHGTCLCTSRRGW